MTLSDYIGATNTFTYDKRNLLLSKTNSAYGSTYTFDYEHRLISAGNIQYTYDGAGNRLQKTENGVVTRYIYDAAGNLLAEADGSNNITKYYVHGLGLIAMVTPANQTYSYHYNATGSTIAITDQTQAIVNKYAYDPFGNITSQQEAISQPFRFVGQFGVMSESNGFYYMRARYYDPNVGRFISEDPIGFEGGDVNLMAYVGNQPINFVDPEGLSGDAVDKLIKFMEFLKTSGKSILKGFKTVNKADNANDVGTVIKKVSPEVQSDVKYMDNLTNATSKGGADAVEAAIKLQDDQNPYYKFPNKIGKIGTAGAELCPKK